MGVRLRFSHFGEMIRIVTKFPWRCVRQWLRAALLFGIQEDHPRCRSPPAVEIRLCAAALRAWAALCQSPPSRQAISLPLPARPGNCGRTRSRPRDRAYRDISAGNPLGLPVCHERFEPRRVDRMAPHLPWCGRSGCARAGARRAPREPPPCLWRRSLPLSFLGRACIWPHPGAIVCTMRRAYHPLRTPAQSPKPRAR